MIGGSRGQSDEDPGATQCRWPLEVGKDEERDSSPELTEEMLSC